MTKIIKSNALKHVKYKYERSFKLTTSDPIKICESINKNEMFKDLCYLGDGELKSKNENKAYFYFDPLSWVLVIKYNLS